MHEYVLGLSNLCSPSAFQDQAFFAGAVLTHSNLIANSAGCSRLVDFLPGDVHISYLPLAHIYERVNTISCTHAGGAIGFYSGDVQRLLDDISTLRPTIFASVPRLWNRIYDKVGDLCCLTLHQHHLYQMSGSDYRSSKGEAHCMTNQMLLCCFLHVKQCMPFCVLSSQVMANV
jgi:hypothetical protein